MSRSGLLSLQYLTESVTFLVSGLRRVGDEAHDDSCFIYRGSERAIAPSGKSNGMSRGVARGWQTAASDCASVASSADLIGCQGATIDMCDYPIAALQFILRSVSGQRNICL